MATNGMIVRRFGLDARRCLDRVEKTLEGIHSENGSYEPAIHALIELGAICDKAVFDVREAEQQLLAVRPIANPEMPFNPDIDSTAHSTPKHKARSRGKRNRDRKRPPSDTMVEAYKLKRTLDRARNKRINRSDDSTLKSFNSHVETALGVFSDPGSTDHELRKAADSLLQELDRAADALRPHRPAHRQGRPRHQGSAFFLNLPFAYLHRNHLTLRRIRKFNLWKSDIFDQMKARTSQFVDLAYEKDKCKQKSIAAFERNEIQAGRDIHFVTKAIEAWEEEDWIFFGEGQAMPDGRVDDDKTGGDEDEDTDGDNDDDEDDAEDDEEEGEDDADEDDDENVNVNLNENENEITDDDEDDDEYDADYDEDDDSAEES